MGLIVIQFEGICVNFRQIDFPFLPAKHRIVLINAREITDVWGNIIARHFAGFSTALGEDRQEFPLNGAAVKITNPTMTGDQTGVTYVLPGETFPIGETGEEMNSYSDLPSLTTLTPEPPLGPVSPAVLLGHNPELVSCYFDVDFGTIGSKASRLNAIMTVVVIQTEGDPQYQLTPFPATLSSTPLQPLQPVQTNEMFFWNEEDSVIAASNDDFMLSYLVVSPPPAEAPNLPLSAGSGSAPNRKASLLDSLSPKVTVQAGFTDVGCSNSTYP